MFMIFKRKQMILTTLVLMLGIAGYLNYRYDREYETEIASIENGDIKEPEIGETVMVSTEADISSKDKNADSFEEERLKRDAAREKTKEELKDILSSDGISQQTRDETQRKLNNLTLFQEMEATAENLISAKGYKDSMVYIAEDSVTVTLKQKGISRSDTAKISDVVYELTKNNNIKIVEVE